VNLIGSIRVVVAGFVLLLAQASGAELHFVCAPSNDLYQLVSHADDSARRYDTPAQAVERAADGAAVLILADRYPDQCTEVPAAIFDRASAKHLRLYIEFARALPGLTVGKVQATTWERGVVASDRFGKALPKLRIVAPHDCHFTPVEAAQPDLVIARVAGFDTAVYGLPKVTHPLLFSMNDGKWLIATTKLSGFVTGRFAPTSDWKTIWRSILKTLDPSHEPPALDFQPLVHPAFSADAALGAQVERETFDRAAAFYQHARLLITSNRRDELHKLLAAGVEETSPPIADTDSDADGSLGMLEGYASRIRFDGSQTQRTPIRADCNAEAAMVLSIDAMLNPAHTRAQQIAGHLLDYVYGPVMQSMGRSDPKHPAYGLVAWGAISPAWKIANYGDDNARVILATLLASAAQKTDRWDRPTLRAIMANLRTTGVNGFRGDRIDIAPLEARGWKAYHDAAPVNPSPHFESYLWACNLWAYARTGDREFLDHTTRAIQMTMDAYAAKKWRWMDNIERSRMLLCLSWLVRLEDTPQHRRWLATIATDLLAAQQPCGAIEERLGGTGGGHYQIPQSNEAYGTAETPLIQTPGDPATDQLYTTGFALFALHEAVAATADSKLKAAEDRLAQFICRTQVRSEKLPYLDGAWFRAFDYKRWEYWASSADMGWGVWAVEAGWGQAWIATTLALREKQTSMWDLTAASNIEAQLSTVRDEMSENAGGPWKQP
jgi:hypothetical protein